MKPSEIKTKNSIASKIRRILRLSKLIRFSKNPRVDHFCHEDGTLQTTWYHSVKNAVKIAQLNADRRKAYALMLQQSPRLNR